MRINELLEKIALGYQKAKQEWMADRRNTFKDGRLLAYYEAKESVLKLLDSENPLAYIADELQKHFQNAKAEWKADRKNTFKDGKLLGWYELTTIAAC